MPYVTHARAAECVKVLFVVSGPEKAEAVRLRKL